MNLNNVPVSEKQFLAMFEALKTNETLEDLSMANTTLGDFAAANLACSIESNKALEKVNIESNNVTPQTLVKLFEVNIHCAKIAKRIYYILLSLKIIFLLQIFLFIMLINRQLTFNKCYQRSKQATSKHNFWEIK